MLPSQVGAIDLTRPGNKGIASREREAPRTRSHLRRVLSFWLASVWMCVAMAAPQVSGQSKGRKKRTGRVPGGTEFDEHSVTNWTRSQGSRVARF